MTAATRAKATRGERTRRCGAAKSVGVVMSRKTPSIVPKSWKLRRRLYHVRHAGDLEPPREDPPPAGLGPRPGDDHADPRRSRSSRDRPHPRRRPPAGLQRALERAGHPAVDGLVPPPPPARGRDHTRTGAGHAAPDLAAARRAGRALHRPARRADALAATYRTRTTTALGGAGRGRPQEHHRGCGSGLRPPALAPSCLARAPPPQPLTGPVPTSSATPHAGDAAPART